MATESIKAAAKLLAGDLVAFYFDDNHNRMLRTLVVLLKLNKWRQSGAVWGELIEY
jgi:hypothetical protein